jgi:hypothetical protein
MRAWIPPLALVLLCCAGGRPASAQEPRTTLLAGYGAVDHEASLGPAVHLNLRRSLLRVDVLAVPPSGPPRRLIPRFEAQAEAFGQWGESGLRVGGCSEAPERLCSRGARPMYLLGAGLVTRVEYGARSRPVQVYFLPLTGAAYLRHLDLEEQVLGSPESMARQETGVAAGIGNGLGIQARIGGVHALLEMRAILMRDLQGWRGGSVPVSVGISW